MNLYYRIGCFILKRHPKALPDRYYLKCFWKKTMGSNLSLRNPKTLNEKLQWIKIHDRNPLYPTLVDKADVKKWISDNIGRQYVIPTYGVYDSPEEIDYESFPNKFVLKCTHDSGSTIICGDKASFDKESASAKLGKSLNQNFYWWAREWPYKYLKPRIICEQLLVKKDGTLPNDYKFHCINGKIQFIYVSYDRTGVNDRCLYDTEWKRLPFVWIAEGNYRPELNKTVVPRPDCYNEMAAVATKIASLFKYVRVDFYDVDGRPYLGEITLFHGGGFDKFFPEEYDAYYGNILQLKQK